MKRRWVPRLIRGGESVLPPRLRRRHTPREEWDDAAHPGPSATPNTHAVPHAAEHPAGAPAPARAGETSDDDTRGDTPRRATA